MGGPKIIEKKILKAEEINLGPWKKYRELRKQPNVMSLDTFIQKLNAVIDDAGEDDYGLRLGTAGLIAALYLTGCRITEIIRPRKSHTVRYKRGKGDAEETITKTYSYLPEGLRLKDITTYPDFDPLKPDRVRFIQFNVKVRKRGATDYRNAIAVYDDPEDEYYPIIQIFEKYVKLAFPEDRKDLFTEDSFIFDTTERTARKYIMKYMGVNPHYIRHLRASHLMRYNNLTTAELKKFFEWKSADMPLRYAAADITDIEKKIGFSSN